MICEDSTGIYSTIKEYSISAVSQTNDFGLSISINDDMCIDDGISFEIEGGIENDIDSGNDLVDYSTNPKYTFVRFCTLDSEIIDLACECINIETEFDSEVDGSHNENDILLAEIEFSEEILGC